MSTRNTITTAYTARFIANNYKFPSLSHREHCSLSRSQIEMIGLNLGQQVRILRPTVNETKLALYTIKDVHNDNDSEYTVLVGYENQNDLQERLQLPKDEHYFNGKIDDQVIVEGLTDAQAEEYNEFIEHLTDDGQSTGLIIIAPHGGNIERHTDEQAEYVYEKLLLSSNRVSTWICKGFNKDEDGGAFNRWHITSTDISEKSFPKLKAVFDRGFEYAVAFHGFNDENHPKSICIGGLVEDKTLKEDIKKEIVNAVAGSGTEVYMDNECPRNINGNDKNNIVNRLSNNGLQIEQSKEVRVDEDLRLNIADAVARVIGPRIKVEEFFGTGDVLITEQELRNAIGNVAKAERDNWRDKVGKILLEHNDSQFGVLVKYWLASASSIRPTTLNAVQTKALSSDTDYGELLNDNATNMAVGEESEFLSETLLMDAPDTASPANLRDLVKHSLTNARFSRLDAESKGRWSAAFVLNVIRKAAIKLGLEAMRGSAHVGRDLLLVGTSAHRVYVLEAYNRRFGTNRSNGTYHAFRPNERRPQIGDIVIQDRRANSIDDVVKFDQIPTILKSEYNLHGDIVVDAPNGADYILAVGGNVGDSVMCRRYPLDLSGHLVVDHTQLYAQEDHTCSFPNVVDTDNSPALHVRSTGRIFALLSLVP